jgi:secernin
MHAGTQTQAGQTAGSLVSELRAEGAVHWLTATALPCTSIFKPVLMDVPLPPHGCPPTDRFDAKALWWRHEQLNRMATLADLERLRADIAPERDAIEEEFRTRIYAVLKGGSAADRARVVAECWRQAIDMEERWHARVKLDPIRHDEAYVAEWHRLNQLAELSW